MSTLVSTARILPGDPSLYGRRALKLLMGRIVRFNIALYLTFVSVIVLAVGTIALI